jgi:hypothetical protein
MAIQRENKTKVIFLCGAKDFHAMDKLDMLVESLGRNMVLLVTDTLSGEGQKCLMRSEYNVESLYIIDRWTLSTPSRLADLWRNFIKLIFLPFQAVRLRNIYRQYNPSVVHATPIYYMLLCSVAGVPFIGTPQAAEIIERPKRNLVYRYFASIALHRASKVVVDSKMLVSEIQFNFLIKPILIKNGFLVDSCLEHQRASQSVVDCSVLSVRALQSYYRVLDILKSADLMGNRPKIRLAYPSYHSGYRQEVRAQMRWDDEDLAMLDRESLYYEMSRATLVVSIPLNDSSPRSVYESIMCGAIVAVTPSDYLDELPGCMLDRIVLVRLHERDWLSSCFEVAREKRKKSYIPSDEAIEMCDKYRLFKKFSPIYLPE